MYRLLLCAIMATAIGATVSHAQESDEQPTPQELKEQLEGANERIILLENDVAKLKQTKISGYTQIEWQHFDQNTSAGGRALYSNANKNLFTIRRGRLKVQHKLNEIMSGTIQADFTEGGVGIKDAYLSLTPYSDDALTINVGLFNKPNYEVELSSSARESIERAQVTRAFYPGERDLGVMLMTHQELFENFDPKLQIGIFNGQGTVAEIDAYKDIIARLTFPLPLGYESPVQVDLGASFFYGGIPQTGTKIIKTIGETNQTVDNEETGAFAGFGNRQNFNIESQIYVDILPFGGTILKGEVMMGKRPTAPIAGTAASVIVGKDSANNPIPVVKAATEATPLQIRNQSGYYAYFIQNIGTRLQIVAKYDYFDRNTDLAAAQVKSASDAASGVLGFGVNVFVDNLRITAFYEIPSFAADENGADVKDNKTTVRFQYKF